MSTSSLHAESFDHLTIVVADLAASSRFYVDLLGLSEVDRPAFDFQGAWFGTGNCLIHLILANELSGQPGPRNHDVTKPSRDFILHSESLTRLRQPIYSNRQA